MSLKLGTTDVTAMKLGVTDVSKLMLGTAQVWPSTPSAPLGLSAVPSGSDVNLTWTAPAIGSPITDYVIEYCLLSEIADRFNRVDGPIGTPWVAQHNAISNLTIVSNRVDVVDGVATPGQVSHVDHYVQATINCSTNTYCGVQARDTGSWQVGGARNQIGGEIGPDRHYEIAEFTAGGGHNMLVSTGAGAYPADTDVLLRLECQSATARLYADGVQILTATIPSMLTGKGVGMGGLDQGGKVTLDNFEAGPLVPAVFTPYSDAVSAALAATVTGLAVGLYAFRVAAVNSSGQGPWSTTSNVVSIGGGGGVTIPGAPTGLLGSSGDSQVDLVWTPGPTGGAAITDYVVQWALNSAPTVWTTFVEGVNPAPSANVTGLTNGTAYIFRVAARNSAGDGPYSTPSTAVTPSVAAWTPASLASLYAWYDANDLSTFSFSSGAIVAQWRDKKGGRHLQNGNTSEQPNRSNTINGVPCITFDGSDDQLIVSGWTSVLAQPCSVFIVCRFAGSGSWQAVFNVAFQFEILREGGGDRAKWVSGGSDQMVNISTNVPYILGSTYSPYQQRLNGVQIATTNTGSNGIDAWRTGRAGHGGDRMNGSVGEIIVCNAALTGTDLSNLESYLMTKWGIS